jgi:hypothetical protein
MVWFGSGGRGLWAAPPPAGKPVRAQAAASQRFSLMDKLYMRQVWNLWNLLRHCVAFASRSKTYYFLLIVKIGFGTLTGEETSILFFI